MGCILIFSIGLEDNLCTYEGYIYRVNGGGRNKSDPLFKSLQTICIIPSLLQ